MRRLLVALIRAYQRLVSPYRPPCCRFYPSCSAYALQAIERFGAVRGGLLAVWRVLRCNPFGRGGLDPVPEAFPGRFSFPRPFSRRGGASKP